MKNYKNICIYDFSDYAEEITGNELFKINGGAEIENTIKAQANAKPGDTVTRDDGTTHTIWQGDIDWAKEIMASREDPCSTQQTNTSETPSISNQTIEKEEEELSVQIQNNWTYNPDELDSDKRFNAKDINGQHLMTIACDDKINFEDFASYYITVGKYGSAGTKVYDGIGLIDKNGNIINILKDDGTVKNYARSLGIPIDDGLHGDLFITAEIDLVAGWGFEGAISLVIDLDNFKDSGVNISGGLAGGCNVGFGVGADYVKRELEGCSPLGVDGNFGYLPFSAAVMTDEEGFNGGSITFGPGMGVSSSVQNSYTLSINTLSKLIK